MVKLERTLALLLSGVEVPSLEQVTICLPVGLAPHSRDGRIMIGLLDNCFVRNCRGRWFKAGTAVPLAASHLHSYRSESPWDWQLMLELVSSGTWNFFFSELTFVQWFIWEIFFFQMPSPPIFFKFTFFLGGGVLNFSLSKRMHLNISPFFLMFLAREGKVYLLWQNLACLACIKILTHAGTSVSRSDNVVLEMKALSQKTHHTGDSQM